MTQETNQNMEADAGPSKLMVALIASIVSAVLSLSGSYANSTLAHRYDSQQRLISERRVAYGKLIGAVIVLKQTEYFRWMALSNRRFYESLSSMEEPGGQSQRDNWQKAIDADEKQASLSLESARVRRDLFETIAMVQTAFPDDARVQLEAAALLETQSFSPPPSRTVVPTVEELRLLPPAQLQKLRDSKAKVLRDEQLNFQSEMTLFLNQKWQVPIDHLSGYIREKYLGIRQVADVRSFRSWDSKLEGAQPFRSFCERVGPAAPSGHGTAFRL